MSKAMNDAILALAALRRESDILDKKVKSLQADIVGMMDKSGKSTIEVETDNRTIKATLVHSTRTTVDTDILADLVSDSMFRAVTVRTIDKAAFAAKVTMGSIPPEVVDKVQIVKDAAPYIKLS